MPARSTHDFGTVQKARWDYKCDRCGQTIHKGEEYGRSVPNWMTKIPRIEHIHCPDFFKNDPVRFPHKPITVVTEWEKHSK